MPCTLYAYFLFEQHLIVILGCLMPTFTFNLNVCSHRFTFRILLFVALQFQDPPYICLDQSLIYFLIYMITVIELRFQYNWSCFQLQATYAIIRITLSENGALQFILQDGNVGPLTCRSPRWVFTLLLKASDFKTPKAEGVRVFIYINELKKVILQIYCEY